MKAAILAPVSHFGQLGLLAYLSNPNQYLRDIATGINLLSSDFSKLSAWADVAQYLDDVFFALTEVTR